MRIKPSSPNLHMNHNTDTHTMSVAILIKHTFKPSFKPLKAMANKPRANKPPNPQYFLCRGNHDLKVYEDRFEC